MRYHFLFLLLFVVTACGGGASSSTASPGGGSGGGADPQWIGYGSGTPHQSSTNIPPSYRNYPSDSLTSYSLDSVFPVDLGTDDSSPRTYRTIYFRDPQAQDAPKPVEVRIIERSTQPLSEPYFWAELSDGKNLTIRLVIERNPLLYPDPYVNLYSDYSQVTGYGFVFPHGMALLFGLRPTGTPTLVDHALVFGHELPDYALSEYLGRTFGTFTSEGGASAVGFYLPEYGFGLDNLRLRIDENAQNVELLTAWEFTSQSFDEETRVAAIGQDGPQRHSFEFNLGDHEDFEDGSVIAGRFFGGGSGAEATVSIGGVYAVELTKEFADAQDYIYRFYWGIYALVPE